MVNFSENEVPTIVGRLVTDMESVENLQVPDLTAGRIPQYILANRLTAGYSGENLVSIFKSATPDAVRSATLELLNATSDYPNFVISSGCDVPPNTPQANIEAFYEALEKYNGD